ncbi:MAG TPA: bifunctional (p)ppGpp synthetase/guanosine-3',5'-bis(diphosphate) 3'-pyrophosphohydrolase [Caulobacteraceae bacterium]|nr:bifunctional (p)ppGpp synthetase/guanosine-3',5'-bis(diphosphate) 3'-pyrophosphohydrolase [Caulobacteraceae bacterium]
MIERVRAYDPGADEGLLNRAYVYAVRMHGSQTRASGDPYFAHPIEVAGILTEYRLDSATIVTALLHDVIEDTEVTRQDVEKLFGAEVAELVEGVTKLSSLEAIADYKRQAENLRKFILAVSKDVRVLLVKLADRLHNMRTLQYLKNAAKRERIARETLEIYAPLARSIGCHRICSELEDLAFAHLNPVARNAIMRRLETLRTGQGAAVAQASVEISQRLADAGVPCRVVGREKTPFSIWRKLQRKSIGFDRLSDIYGFRVIVDTEDDCYRALGIVHRAWPTVPDRFKDFISHPKTNNYRSLHTTVVGPRAMRIEMQIRTEAMDRVAEEGVAAHWRYKNQTYAFDPEAQAAAGGSDPTDNLREFVQILEQGGDAEDLLEHAKLEMFLDQVFVFTPKGRLISLPRGAMPLDFAYAVHTSVGDTCIGVKINGEVRPLRTVLANGDVVEVIRGAAAAPPPDWESLSVTGRSRSAIRRHLRQSEREELTRLGQAAVEQTFERARKPLAEVSLRPALDRFAAPTEAEIFHAVGRGRITPSQVLEAVFPGLTEKERAAATERVRIGEVAPAGLIRGAEVKAGETLRLSPCCLPVPGDRIVGIEVRPGELDVHTVDCHRLAQVQDQQDLWRDLRWTPHAERNTLSHARLHATIRDAVGVLGEACTIIGESGANIIGVNMRHRHTDFFDVDFDVEVMDARHLTHTAAALRACPSIETVERAQG